MYLEIVVICREDDDANFLQRLGCDLLYTREQDFCDSAGRVPQIPGSKRGKGNGDEPVSLRLVQRRLDNLFQILKTNYYHSIVSAEEMVKIFINSIKPIFILKLIFLWRRKP